MKVFRRNQLSTSRALRHPVRCDERDATLTRKRRFVLLRPGRIAARDDQVRRVALELGTELATSRNNQGPDCLGVALADAGRRHFEAGKDRFGVDEAEAGLWQEDLAARRLSDPVRSHGRFFVNL